MTLDEYRWASCRRTGRYLLGCVGFATIIEMVCRYLPPTMAIVLLAIALGVAMLILMNLDDYDD